MRKATAIAMALMMCVAAAAQDFKVKGLLKDKSSGDVLGQATVQLLKSDSTFVTGTISRESGAFQLVAPSAGKYVIRVTSVGYVPKAVGVDVKKQGTDAGTIEVEPDAVMLKTATVTGQALKVTVKEDTFVYNSAAFRTPEGSTIEELVKRLPGAEVDDDGKITINGKEVKKIKIDGKEFMAGDTKTAMKNIPTSIIEKVKAYDDKSDLAKVTGIDDGEEETVLDFGVKKGMNHGFISNTNLAAGTKHRYSARTMGAYFNDNLRLMAFGSANNTNDMGFPGGGRGPRRGGGGGLNASKMAAFNFNYDNGKTLEWNGSLRWNHSDGDAFSRSASENFVSTIGSFSNSISQNFSRSDSWNANMKLEWKPDTMTNLTIRPRFSHTKSDGTSYGSSASYSDDPYDYDESPLEQEAIGKMAEAGVMVNSRGNSSITYSGSTTASGMAQLNRKFGSKGRSVTLRVEGSAGDTDGNSLSTNNVHLYQVLNSMGGDSTYQTNRYSTTPTKTYSYGGRLLYSEPLWTATFLQLSYEYTHSYNKSDRSTYDFSAIGEAFSQGLSPGYRSWGGYLARLPMDYAGYRDSDLSRFSSYSNDTHEAEAQMRIVRPKYNLNFGVMVQPQTSHFVQDYQGKHTDTVRTVTNFTPTLNFRYRFSKVSNLRLNYRGRTSQPSMSDLLDITDDSDPLNISKGNPGLKPSFTNSLRLFYNTYIERRQKAIMAFVNYSNTRNSISRKVTYDETTGGRTTMPENINGNWDASGAFMFNTSIDTAGVWNVNTFTTLNYNNYVGYLSLGKADSQKNTTRSTSVGERLSASYRNDWLEVELDGSLNYTHSRNKLQANSNMDTWVYSYGVNITANAPWGTSLSTNLHQNSRRGYSDASMNTDELVWNAQLSHSFLKGNALTVSLQMYDILHNQSNISRTINAMMRSDTEYNSVNCYGMLSVAYKLNIFGGKSSMGGKSPMGDRDGHGGPGGRRGPGGPPPMHMF